MTAAMYIVALIEARTNNFMDFPNGMKYAQKYSQKGFEKHIQEEFEKGIEPPYVNRNWLLHGKRSRMIERYECIQLFNALSTIEFVFSFCNQ